MNTPGIGKTRLIHTADLNLHHKNPRRGEVDVIAVSLQAHGQFRPIVVNEGTHTGRPLEVIAGNHTLKAIRQLAGNNPDDPRWSKVEAYVIDVDEDQSTKIVLADNRTSDLGTYDETELLALLESVDHDLDGTGYDHDDIEALAQTLTPLTEEEPETAPSDDEDWTVLRFRIPPMIAHQWVMWSSAYDSPEEAFEALMDKSTDYAGGY